MNELIKTNKNLIVSGDKKSLADIIKPLKKEIPLLDYYVSDLNEQCSDLTFLKIKTGDSLQLKADNKIYRETSVGVYIDGERIGELYEEDERIPYNLLTAGKELNAVVKETHLSMGEKVMLLLVTMLDF